MQGFCEMILWEAIQGAGTVVAIVTGGFVIWERFFRYQPSAFIVAQPLVPGGQTKGAYLRVQNRSERPIIVSWPNGSSPNSLRIALNHDTRSIVVSLIDGRTSVAIDGHSTHIFPILRPNNWADLNDEQTVEVSVKWSFAQPLLFKRHRSIAVRITKQAYRLLVNEREDLD